MDDSKRKKSQAETMISKQFSPVSKLLSPKTSGRNLTGSARYMKDLTADLHASIQQWNTAHLQGIELLKDITKEKQDESYSQTLQELCDKLENVCDTLDSVVKDLVQIVHKMKLLAYVENNGSKLFTTWPTLKFGQVADLICSAYFNEAKVKHKIFEDVAHHYSESRKMLFLAAWVHQSLLPENLLAALESLLIETGHR